MDIDKITLQVLSEKPKPKFTYGLNLDINTDLNQQYEIMCLMFLRIINEKVSNITKNDDVKEVKKEILRNLFISRLYLNSCGIEFKYENIERKKVLHYNLSNTCNFYSKNKYKFMFAIINTVYRKGKKLESYYNMKKINSFNDLFLIMKIENHYFKIELKLLKK